MNQKELTKTFVMISNWNKPFGLHDLNKIYSALQGLIFVMQRQKKVAVQYQPFYRRFRLYSVFLHILVTHIAYQLLNFERLKRDIYRQDICIYISWRSFCQIWTILTHFVVVNRVSETQFQMGGNYNQLIWQLKG